MSLLTLLVIILIIGAVMSLPRWPYAAGWGYGPSGILGVILVIVVLLLLFGGGGTLHLR